MEKQLDEIGNPESLAKRFHFLVDGHVHFHPTHNADVFVESAVANLAGDGIPTLMMTEVSGARAFEDWRDGKTSQTVRKTAEPDSLVLDNRLLVIAGRQVVTAERIEVLALATAEQFEDGQPLEKTLDEVSEKGGVAVLPWGVGKWIGARGRRVAEVAALRDVLLGDNAGRPFGWPRPAVFSKRPVLPGSDPMKATGDERMVGSYGFDLETEADPMRPAASLRQALVGMKSSPSVLGGRVDPVRFFLRQFRHYLPG